MASHSQREPHSLADALDDAMMAGDDGRLDDSSTSIDVADTLHDKWVADTPHLGARRLFRACPWTRNLPVLGDTIAAFGPKFTASVGGFYFMNNGLAENIINSSRQPMMMRRYGIDATRYQRLAGVVTMGSSIKVLMATFSDTFAIFGYRKRWYQLGSSVIGFAFCLGYALLPARPSSADIAAAFIFLCTFCRMNSDILTQGYYSRLIRRKPAAGPKLVTWIYWMVLLATLIAAVMTGPLADHNRTRDGIFVSAIMHLLPGIIFACNGYSEKTNRVERREDVRLLREDVRKAHLANHTEPAPSLSSSSQVVPTEQESGASVTITDGQPLDAPAEERCGSNTSNTNTMTAAHKGAEKDSLTAKPPVSPSSHALAHLDADDVNNEEEDDEEEAMRGMITCCRGLVEINKEMVTRNWKIVLYSCIMVACVITMACMTILGTTWDLLYTCIAVSVVCLGGAFACLPRVIAKTEVAVFLDFVLYIQLPGALDSFYVADAACLPDGPHFSYSFYTTVGAVLQNIGGVIGVTLFAYVFSKHSFQMVITTTVLMRMVASIFDLVVVKRWNLYIGIPDHAMYICGDAIVLQLVAMLNMMPLVLLLSRVVPRGSESMVYALMSSIGNLGMTMSNTVGSLLMELVWPVDTQSTPCDFSNVPWLIITGHLLVPILIIPVAFIFLPRTRMCDDIDVNGNVIKKQLENEQQAKTTAAEPLHDEASA